jgi:hypothetical protein
MKKNGKQPYEDQYEDQKDGPRDPLDGVITTEMGGPILRMQVGLFNLGRNRARQSGTTVSQPEDLQALENHARAMARETYRDRYDPAQNPHDAMHKAEYEKNLARREEAEKGEQHAAANLRDAENGLAQTPKAGEKPAAPPLLVAAFVVAITLTVAPTLHDAIFLALGDNLLEWFAAMGSAAFVGVMLTLAILSGRRTAWTWVGVGAGVILGCGLGAIRLAAAGNAREVLFALGLTVMEIAAVLLLEWLASGLRARDAVWSERHTVEIQAIASRDAAQADLARWQARIRELTEAIARQIALVEDRHNRNIHIGELEAVAVKAVNDGYNAGITENVGRVRGVNRRN